MSEAVTCPSCKGNCCVNKHGTPCEHGAVLALHSCLACDDGTYEVCSEPEPFVPPRTAEDERADVVAWLNYARSHDALAYARFIASGGHVGWAKGVKP